jgi:hypothetical protein
MITLSPIVVDVDISIGAVGFCGWHVERWFGCIFMVVVMFRGFVSWGRLRWYLDCVRICKVDMSLTFPRPVLASIFSPLGLAYHVTYHSSW